MSAIPLILLFILPALGILAFLLADGFSPEGWSLLWDHPQLWPALGLSLFTGTCSTLIALFTSLMIGLGYFIGGRARQLTGPLGAMLAVPHLAFGIGLSFLVMPSGLMARILALPLGWVVPPSLGTTHDRYGITLIIALAAKETCFLLFALLQVLTSQNRHQSLAAQSSAAQALGHGGFSIATRIILPQVWREIAWPLAIVFIYATNVVDLALVLGPTQPPTLAQVAWVDINAARATSNLRGAAAAMLLAGACASLIGIVAFVLHTATPALARAASAGPSARAFPLWLARGKWAGFRVIFAAAGATLVLLSFAQLWTFPALVPQVIDVSAWAEVAAHPQALVTSLGLGMACAFIGLIALVGWLEATPARWDRPLAFMCLAMLGLPALLTGLGLYHLLLELGLTATLPGLFTAHFMSALAYMFIMLAKPYRSFDRRWGEAASGLMVGPIRYLAHVKWPLLRAPLAASAAVGFAVAFAQYVPAQLVAGGRYDTLTIEAVTLSSGGNRALTAAFGLLLMLPPLLAFMLSSWLGRQRWAEDSVA